MTYTSKPQQVEAVQWTGHSKSAEAVMAFCDGKARIVEAINGLQLLAGKEGAQGWVPVPIDHWIVNAPGDKTDIWPVEDAYFKAKYEAGDTALPKLRCEAGSDDCMMRMPTNFVRIPHDDDDLYDDNPRPIGGGT